ncbi:UNVERIFIED_CONTAM: hypothetical protein NCL1_48099 [Trichonephila clavipes]
MMRLSSKPCFYSRQKEEVVSDWRMIRGSKNDIREIVEGSQVGKTMHGEDDCRAPIKQYFLKQSVEQDSPRVPV